MIRPHPRRFRHVAVLLLALALSACGGGGSDPVSQSTTPQAEASEPVSAPGAGTTPGTPISTLRAVLTDEGLSIQGPNAWGGNPMLFWDNVETGYEAVHASLGAEVGTGASSPWGAVSSTVASRFKYESATTRSGETGVVYRGAGYRPIFGKPRYTGSASAFDHLYVSWWYRPSIDPGSEGASNKFIRLWDDGNGYGTRISWTQMHMTCDVPAGYTPEVSWKSWGGNAGQWNRMEVDANLAKPLVSAWVNGAVRHQHPCVKDPAQASKPLWVYVLGFDHGGNADGSVSYQDMVTEVADIYIANSPARVEISDSPTWAAATRREVLPVKHWDAQRIDLGFLRGVFPAGTPLYAYVINPDGSTTAQGTLVTCTGLQWC